MMKRYYGNTMTGGKYCGGCNMRCGRPIKGGCMRCGGTMTKGGCMKCTNGRKRIRNRAPMFPRDSKGRFLKRS